MSPPNGRHSERVRDRFEAAWRSAESAESRPHLGDFLLDVPEPERVEALCSLLAVELHYRQRLGEQPTPDEYIQMFPGSASHIQLIFRTTGRTGETESAPSAHAPRTKKDLHSSLDTPTLSFFAPREAEPTDGSKPRGEVSPGSQTTEALDKKKHKSRALPLPTVPGYEILDELGEGGMGIVYRALDVRLQCLVALKMINPRRGSSTGPPHMERMLVEARAVARCSHPNLVHIYKIDEHDGQPYMSLEYLAGGNLSHKLKGMPQPAREAAALTETLARAMDFTHKRDIVHRDLKPSNILLAADGTPKIGDFGLAKRLDQNTDPIEEGWIVGTTMYMAAEQAWGRNDEVGAPADIYSLGAILYEMLTGRPPFKAANRQETLQLVRTADPVPPRQLVPQVPYDLELICLKCLKKKPAERYASAGQLADELRNFLEGRPMAHTRPTPLWERSWKWTKRQPALASLLAVSFLAMLILMVSIYQRAQMAEDELQISRRVSNQRDQVQQLHLQAQEAAEQGRLDEAHGRLNAAFLIIGSESALEKMKPDLDSLQAEVTRRDEVRLGKQNAEQIYRSFMKLRDDALFHGMIFTGVDLPANVEATKAACRAGLALFGLPNAEGRPVLPKYLTKHEECTAACYELLLIWAEAEAPPGTDGSKPAPKQLEQALAHLDQAARLGLPSTRAYHLRRQRYLELQGNREGAQEENRRGEQSKSAGALDYFLTGDSHFKQRNVKEAAVDFAKAVAEDPGHFWAWYFLGVCNLQLQRPELAQVAFTTCLDKKKDFIWLFLMRGFASAQLNQFNEAERDFKQAESMKPDLQAQYGIRVHQGSLCLRQAKFADEALPMPAPHAFNMNLSLARGVAIETYRTAKLTAALKYLDQARALQPEHYPAYLYLAQACQQQHKLEDAAKWINLAIAKDKDQNRLVQSHLHGQRARLHRQQQDGEAALEDIEAALGHFATAEDHAERARILHALKRPSEAVIAFDEALKLLNRTRGLRPEEAEIYRAKAEALLAARPDDDIPDENEPLREREALLALQLYVKHQGPPSADVFRTMGMLHARRRQVPEAIVAFQEALKLQPDSATFTARGWAYLASEDDRALADFDEAIRRDPDNAGAYAGRGLIRARKGLRAEASADARIALERSGENPGFLLLWNVAHVYAQNAAVAGSKNLRTEFLNNREKGLDILERAFLSAPSQRRREFWAEYVAQDALLAALHGSSRFARLKQDYGQEAPIPANK